jgi:hypothetical protein
VTYYGIFEFFYYQKSGNLDDLGSRIFAVWWYRFRFQNSRTVGDIDLKFGLLIVLGKLEDLVGCFLTGDVHK